MGHAVGAGGGAVDEALAARARSGPQPHAVLAELVRFSRRNTLSALGGFVGGLILVVALAAPLLAPRDPLKADFRRMNKPPMRRACSAPIRWAATR